MSLFLLADGTHAGFDKHRSRFFWEGVGNKRKQHWVNWAEVCQPKDQGGLGITNTKIMNIALMVTWVWCLFTENPENTLWQEPRGKWHSQQPTADLPSGAAFTRLKVISN
jgi:hypothetical protein